MDRLHQIDAYQNEILAEEQAAAASQETYEPSIMNSTPQAHINAAGLGNSRPPLDDGDPSLIWLWCGLSILAAMGFSFVWFLYQRSKTVPYEELALHYRELEMQNMENEQNTGDGDGETQRGDEFD